MTNKTSNFGAAVRPRHDIRIFRTRFRRFHHHRRSLRQFRHLSTCRSLRVDSSVAGTCSATVPSAAAAPVTLADGGFTISGSWIDVGGPT